VSINLEAASLMRSFLRLRMCCTAREHECDVSKAIVSSHTLRWGKGFKKDRDEDEEEEEEGGGVESIIRFMRDIGLELNVQTI